jgi:hypothetical protein
VDFIANPPHRDVAHALGYERGHAPVTLAVLGQHLISGEHIIVAGGEIAVAEEKRVGDVFLHDRRQNVGIKEIQNSHCVVPPYRAGDTDLNTMPRSRSLSLSASVTV